MKIAVQMDAPAGLNPKGDSTIVLLREAAKRGDAIYYYHATALSWRAGEVSAPLQRLHMRDGNDWFTLDAPANTVLSAMDVVLMRQDPPFDMGYITATYLLDKIGGTTKVLNDPTAVRSYPEKFLPMDYLEAMPDTLITPHHSMILDFLDEHHDIILKPLYGWGGHSVLRLRRDGDNIAALLEMLAARDPLPMIAQPFLPDVTTQDIRVVMINGKVEGAFSRTPASGEVRANMRVGGLPIAVELNQVQQDLCERIAPALADQGLYFSGLDFIGNMLTEINVTSPTGLKTLEDLYGSAPASVFWDGCLHNHQTAL